MTKFEPTREVYDKYPAEFADKFEKIPETEQLDEFIAMLPPEAVVLDLGSGSGRDSEYLTQSGLQVVGIDLSSGLIAEAQKRRPEIDFRVMDMEKLEFPEKSFDAVWSKLTILHLEKEKLPGVLGAVRRLLKDNGLLMIETKMGEGEGVEPVSFTQNEERYFVYYELEELKKAFEQAGFGQVQGYEYTVGNEHATIKKTRVVVWGKKN